MEHWNNGYLTIEIEPRRGQGGSASWFSLYGAAGSEASALEARQKELLNGAFADL